MATARRPRARKLRPPREQALQKSVEDYLECEKQYLWFMRTNPGDRIIEGKRRSYRIRGAPTGTADVIGCVLGGSFFGIELKRTEKDKPGPKQIEWAIRIRRLGGTVIKASSVREVRDFIQSLKAKGRVLLAQNPAVTSQTETTRKAAECML